MAGLSTADNRTKAKVDDSKKGKRLMGIVDQNTNAEIIIDHILSKLKNGEKILGKDIKYLEVVKSAVGLVPAKVEDDLSSVLSLPHFKETYKSVTVSERDEMRVAKKVGRHVDLSFERLKLFTNTSGRELGTKRRMEDSDAGTPRGRKSPRTTVCPAIITPPRKSKESIFSQARIGISDIETVLDGAKDLDNRKALVKQLVLSGKVEVQRMKGSEVTQELVWAAYCDKTTPKPKDGSAYSKTEVREYLDPYVPPPGKRSVELASRIDALIRTGCCFTTTERGVRDVLYGKSSREFGQTGRPKIDRTALLSNAKSVKEKHGHMHEDTDSKAALGRAKMESIKASGQSTLTVDSDNAVSTSTARRATVEMAMTEEGYALTDIDPIEKDWIRKVFENSARNGIVEAHVNADAGYIIMKGEVPLPPGWEGWDPEKLSSGAKRLYERVKKRNPACTIIPVHPTLVIATDETGLLVVEGVYEKNQWKWRLVDAEADTSTHSYYTESKSDAKPGVLRVKLCLTTNAVGMVAAIWILVSGLSEDELPREHHPHGVCILPIEGLCPEAASDPSIRKKGFVCLTRKSSSDDEGVSTAQKKFREYHDNVTKEFINMNRRNLGWEGGDVPEWLRVKSHCDGDIPQIKAILEDIESDLGQHIWHCKSAARASGSAAAADAQRTHANLKAVNNKLTAVNAPLIGLKKRVTEMFDKLRSDGKVVLRKQGQLIDLVATAPELYKTAVTVPAVRKGFEEAGHTDKKSNWAPDETYLLSTNKTTMTEAEESICEDTWSPDDPNCDYYQFVRSTGEVPEEAHDYCLIREDTDKDGKVIFRPNGIDKIHCQRGRIISKEPVVKLMQEKEQEVEDAKYSAAMLEHGRRNDMIERVDRILMGLVPQSESNLPGSSRLHTRKIRSIGLSALTDLPVDDIKDVIIAYSWNQTCKPSKFKWPTKYPKASKGKKKMDDVEACYNKLSLDGYNEETKVEDYCLVAILAWLLHNGERKLKAIEKPQRVIADPFGRKVPHVATVIEVPMAASLPKAKDVISDGALMSKFASAVRVLTVREDICQGGAAAKDEVVAQKATELLRDRHADFKMNKLREVGLGDKADHVVYKCYEDNFHVAASVLTACGFLNEDLDFVGLDRSALKLPGAEEFAGVEGDILSYWGTYLYADVNVMAWIRSGKASGSGGFKDRIDYHLKAAMKKALGSCNDKRSATFYQLYVSKLLNAAAMRHVKEAGVVKGYHEDLKVKVGFAIDPKSDYSSLCDGSTFVWRKEVLDYLSKKDCGSLKSLEEKQAELLCYFFEHVFERLMEKNRVVSWSAGSERYIGVSKEALNGAVDVDEGGDDAC